MTSGACPATVKRPVPVNAAVMSTILPPRPGGLLEDFSETATPSRRSFAVSQLHLISDRGQKRISTAEIIGVGGGGVGMSIPKGNPNPQTWELLFL